METVASKRLLGNQEGYGGSLRPVESGEGTGHEPWEEEISEGTFFDGQRAMTVAREEVTFVST